MTIRIVIFASTLAGLVAAGTTIEAFGQARDPAALEQMRERQAANRREAAATIRLAEEGDVKSQIKAGVMYHMGSYVQQNLELARYWFHQAADQGDAEAQYQLGMFYDQEIIPEDVRNPFLAAPWFRKSAEQGHVGAQYRLARLYRSGEGIPEDRVQAYAWLNVVAARGPGRVQEQKEELAEIMTPEQIAKAQELSAVLWEKFVVPFQKF